MCNSEPVEVTRGEVSTLWIELTEGLPGEYVDQDLSHSLAEWAAELATVPELSFTDYP